MVMDGWAMLWLATIYGLLFLVLPAVMVGMACGCFMQPITVWDGLLWALLVAFAVALLYAFVAPVFWRAPEWIWPLASAGGTAWACIAKCRRRTGPGKPIRWTVHRVRPRHWWRQK